MRLNITPLALALGAGRSRGLNTERNPPGSGEEPIIGTADDGAPVVWPTPSLDRAGNVVCFGASGTGKSALIGNAIARELAVGQAAMPPGQQPAALVIIPKSDFRLILEQATAALAPAALPNMVCLNPFSPTGFPFNLNRLALGDTPIEIRAWQLANLVAEVSTSAGQLRSGSASAGARQIDVLNNLLLAALTVDDPRANVLLAYDALVTPRGFERLATLTTSERARGFLAATKLGDELAASVSARLRMAFGATASLERMVGSNACVQFDDLTAPGRLCILDLGRPFGGMVGLQIFWSSLVAALGIDHALARPSPFTNGHHLRIVIDEVQIVASVLAQRAESLLTTGRARAVSSVYISQGTALIARAADTLIPTLLTNCPTKIVGRLSAPDAELLSSDLSPTPGNTERPKFLRERFAAAVSNLPERRFFHLTPGRRQRFTSAPLDMARFEVAAEEQAELIAAAEQRFALPASTPPRTTLAELTPDFETSRVGRRGPRPGSVAAHDAGQPPPRGEDARRDPRSRWG